MTLNLLKRAEKGAPLNVTEHDANLTAIEDEVNAKVGLTDPALTDAREWTAPTATQAQAEEGTSEARLAWSPVRVWQAIAAWWAASPAKAKLDTIQPFATANSSDAALVNRANHTGTQPISSVSGLQPALDAKEAAGAAAAAVGTHVAAANPHPVYPLASSLAAVATSGSYGDLTGRPALGTAAPLNVAASGNAAAGEVVKGDDSRLADSREWTAATVTQAEAQAGTDTNRRAWTVQRVWQAAAAWWAGSADKAKLDTIQPWATANATDASLRDRATHTGTQPWSTITGTPTTTAGYGITDAAPSSHVGSGGAAHAAATGAAAGFMSATDKTKLDGIAAGATANATDAQLRDRSTHTGTQAISTVTGLQTALDSKAGTAVATTSAAGLMSSTDKSKLDGVAAGATANSTDAQLRDRATHTGTQAASTISMATARLLGRTTAGSGGAEEIAVGTGLSLASGVLQTTGTGLPTGVTSPGAGTLAAAAGTITTSLPSWDATQTWNAAGVTFTGWRVNITDTASAAASLLMGLQVGGSSRLSVRKDGQTLIAAAAGVAISTPLLGLRNSTGTGYVDMGVDANGGRLTIGSSGNGPALRLENVITMSSSGQVNWTSGDVNATTDLTLQRDAANTLAQLRGTNAQAFRLYNTFTDASNFERAFWRWNSNVLQIGTEAAGTGTQRPISFPVGNKVLAGGIDLGANALNVWTNAAGAPLAVQSNGAANGNTLLDIILGNTVTGNIDAFKASGSCTGILGAVVQQNGNGDALFLMNVLGTGNARMTWRVNGVQEWSAGLHQSDGRKFKLSASGVFGTNDVVTVTTGGNVGVGAVNAPTARVHLPAGTATAGSAPLKLTSGTNLTTPENGALEFDGTNLYFTVGGVRRTVQLV